MTVAAILDTGPLVAILDRADRYHDWSVARLSEIQRPLLICEPVLAETMFLVDRTRAARDPIFTMIERGALRLDFRIADHVAELRALLRRYRDRPMSLADACLVRMAEIHKRHRVFTLDSDFMVYRKNGREPLALIHPSAN